MKMSHSLQTAWALKSKADIMISKRGGPVAWMRLTTGVIRVCVETTCDRGMYFSKYRQSISIGDCELAKKCMSMTFQGNISCLNAYLFVTATDGWGQDCSCE